jgi:hypothetical protein
MLPRFNMQYDNRNCRGSSKDLAQGLLRLRNSMPRPEHSIDAMTFEQSSAKRFKRFSITVRHPFPALDANSRRISDIQSKRFRLERIASSHEMISYTCEMISYTCEMMPYTHEMMLYTHMMMPYTHKMMPYTHKMMPYTRVMMLYTHEKMPYTQMMMTYTHVMMPYTCVMMPYTREVTEAALRWTRIGWGNVAECCDSLAAIKA